jgi:hypothetical protein
MGTGRLLWEEGNLSFNSQFQATSQIDLKAELRL